MAENVIHRKRLLEDSFDITPAGLQFCFDRELFLKDEFNVDKFVMRQKKVVPLELLRDDLLQYFHILKNSLVELINQDYADFVNLSTNLVGLDKVIGTIESPIEKWKLEIESVRNRFSETLNEIDRKKMELKVLRSKRELIHSIEGVQRCIIRLEKWLNIADDGTGNRKENSGDLFGVRDTETGLQEDLGQRLERIGNEFSKLEYFTKKCLQHILVEKFKPRIVTITSELQAQLEGHFISSLRNGNRKSTQQALRTYLGINKGSVAEQLYRENFVRPLLEKITSSKPPAEMVLSELYRDVLKMADSLLRQLEEVLTDDGDRYELLKDFDFLVNSIYPEIAYYFISNLPQIFSPGNPELFHERYTCTMAFVDDFELKCRNVAQLKNLRNSKPYNDFINKWSVAVYFQIRNQEISSLIDKEVSRGSLSLAKPGGTFHYSMISTLHDSIVRCWSDGVYVDGLKHRFWRLTCQILNFLVKFIETIDWKKDVVTVDTVTTEDDTITMKTMFLVDLLRFLRLNSIEQASLEADSRGLLWIYDELLANRFGDDLSDKQRMSLQEVLVGCSNAVVVAMEALASTIQTALTEQCLAGIKGVFDIPRQYRRTNRPWPSKPSDYVASISRPLVLFLDENPVLKGDRGPLRAALFRGCVLDVTTSYREQVRDLLVSVRKMEDSLKRLKLTRGGAVGSEPGSGGVDKSVTDDDKIRRQVAIDVEEFGRKSAEILGQAPDSVAEITEFLRSVVEAS